MLTTWPFFHTLDIRCNKKASAVADASVSLGLKIHKGKSKVTDTPITLEGEALDEVESFTFLGSIVDNTGEDRS